MNDEQFRTNVLHTLNQAKNEIINLRRRNEILQAQVDVIVVFKKAMSSGENCVASIDALWELEHAINHIERCELNKPDKDPEEPLHSDNPAYYAEQEVSRTEDYNGVH